VPVRINGSEAIDFILDTGEAITLIDASVAEKLGLKVAEPKSIAVPGGTVKVGSIAGVTIATGTAELKNATIQAAPVGFASGVIGHRIGGILGHDFIRHFSIKIDYAQRTIALLDPAAFRYDGQGTVIPVKLEDDQAFLPVVIKPHGHSPITGKFKLDTGSIDALGMNNNFVVDEQVLAAHEPKRQMPGIAFGGDTKGYLFRLEWARVGPTTFNSPSVGYTTDSKGFENRSDAGTIGSDLLAHFILYLDYERGRIILEPRGPAAENQRWDHVGVMLRADPANLQDVLIYAVVAHTPAESAGLRSGDHIVSVNGRGGLSLAETWESFKADGPLLLGIVRSGIARTVRVKTAALLPP